MPSTLPRGVTVSAALLCMTVALATPAAAASNASSPAPSIALSSGAKTVPVGTWMTFTTTYPSTVRGAMIEVNCTESGANVWGQVGATTASYKLGGDSSPWLQVGGNADCVAQLVNITWPHKMESVVVLASTAFLGTV